MGNFIHTETWSLSSRQTAHYETTRASNASISGLAEGVNIRYIIFRLKHDLLHLDSFSFCNQMLSYETQLALKKRVVEKAYETFSGLESAFVPSVLPTIASPMQYGYRTKITPHFDVPPKSAVKSKDWEIRIGFDQKGRRSVMDIEVCLICRHFKDRIKDLLLRCSGMPNRD